MKTQCALKILNRMLAQFPSIYNVARFLQRHLQALVDQKSSIDNKLYTLAMACKNNLEKKMSTMPDRPPEAPPVEPPKKKDDHPEEAKKKPAPPKASTANDKEETKARSVVTSAPLPKETGELRSEGLPQTKPPRDVSAAAQNKDRKPSKSPTSGSVGQKRTRPYGTAGKEEGLDMAQQPNKRQEKDDYDRYGGGNRQVSRSHTGNTGHSSGGHSSGRR